MKLAGKTVAIDLDGVILDFDWDEWIESGMAYFGKPKADSKVALRKLKRMGYKIIIHTCRTRPDMHGLKMPTLRKYVREILKSNNIPYDEIWSKQGKPLASYYIDDCAIEFKNWEQVLKKIKNDK